jgi:hypothetical protein
MITSDFLGDDSGMAQEVVIFAPMQKIVSEFAFARILVRECDFRAGLIFSKRNPCGSPSAVAPIRTN